MDTNILKELTVLYVEDDTLIRNELSALLSKFFKNVICATNGLEGIEQYKKNKKSIDMIISDINMPQLSGIDMIKGIRTIDESIPVVFTTAYSDKEFLVEAIKLKADEYVIKPIDVRNLITILNKLGTVIRNAILLEKNRKELENYKKVIDSNNIVIKTDTSFNITSVNDLFCETALFSKDELLGKNFIVLKHLDVSSSIFEEIQNSLNTNKTWKGKIKFIIKDSRDSFTAETYIINTHNEEGDITGVMCILNDITDDINKKRNTQLAMMKDKGEIFIKSKETSAESTMLINELNHANSVIQKDLINVKVQKDKYMYNYAKLKSSYKQLKADLAHHKREEKDVSSKSGMTLKTNKENSDFRMEIKSLKENIETLKENYEKEIKQLTINNEVECDDLKIELNDLKEKITDLGNIDIINQKIEYWKQKAKTESKRAADIEKKVVLSGDESFLKKIFTNK